MQDGGRIMKIRRISEDKLNLVKGLIVGWGPNDDDDDDIPEEWTD